MPHQQRDNKGPPRTVWGIFRKALRTTLSHWPVSFYLLLLIPVTMVFAVPAFYTKDDPKTFMLHLALLFVFLFVVLIRAFVDVLEAARRLLSEKERVFRKTIGDDEFVHELGRRVDREKQ